MLFRSYNSINIGGIANIAVLEAGTIIGDGGAISDLNASNVSMGTLSTSVLPLSGVVSGRYGDFANVSQVTVDQYGRVTTAANVGILSSQWTTVNANVAYQNGVSIGTLTNPPPGSNLYVLGTANVSTLNVTNLIAESALVYGTSTLNVYGISNLNSVTALL